MKWKVFILFLFIIPHMAKSQKADTNFLKNFYLDPALLKEVQYQQALIGTKMQEFYYEDIKGNIYTAEELKEKTILVHFWFLTCGGCIKESPLLNQLYQEYKNDPDVVILTYASNTKEELQKFEAKDSLYFGKKWNIISKHPTILFPIAVADEAMTNLFRVWGYPANFIIGRNFQLKSIVYAHELDMEDSEFLLLLKEKIKIANQ